MYSLTELWQYFSYSGVGRKHGKIYDQPEIVKGLYYGILPEDNSTQLCVYFAP